MVTARRRVARIQPQPDSSLNRTLERFGILSAWQRPSVGLRSLLRLDLRAASALLATTVAVCLSGRVPRRMNADYLVVGAGAMGMAFVDALIDHADVRVALVDRRRGVGGHWRQAYPFVRLHQSSTFYGVASRVLAGIG